MHARVLLYVIHSAVKVNTGSPPNAMPSFCEKIRNNQLYTDTLTLHIREPLKSGPIIFFSLTNLLLVSHKKGHLWHVSQDVKQNVKESLVIKPQMTSVDVLKGLYLISESTMPTHLRTQRGQMNRRDPRNK